MSDRIGVMNYGRLLQVGSPEAIYERPVNRFVADFIGQTNLLEGTVEDASTVCLRNGARIAVPSTLPTGTSVAVILRPERAELTAQGFAAPGRSTVDGIISEITYLGNAIVYEVELDWMSIEVRVENRPGSDRFAPSTPVSVSWSDDAIALVEG